MASAASSAAAAETPGKGRNSALLAERRIQLAIAISLGLILALGSVAVFAGFRLHTSAEDRYVKEAFPLQSAARDLLLQLVNEETGVRGYLITGDRESLQPYLTARPAAAADLAQLDRLSERRPEITPDLAAARRQVRELGRFFQHQIALAAHGPIGQAHAQDNVLNGKSRFDAFRLAGGRLLADARRIVAEARTSQNRTYWVMLALVVSLAAAAVAVAVGMLVLLPKRMRRLYEREQEARLEAERGARAARALEHVEAGVVLLDDTGRVRYWNPGAARILDVAEEDALLRRADEASPALARVEQALGAADGHALTPVELFGGERWLAATQTAFPEGRVLVLRDVTTEQRLEHARSDFLATASHELRTPLSAVYGAVRTLRRTDRPYDPGLSRRLLTMIEEESNRLNEIVEQILVSAQIDRGDVRLDLEICDLRELCESAIATMALRNDSQSISLDAPEEAQVLCDRAKLRQVVLNLLDNAVKYSPDGGTIEIRVSRANGAATIEVCDEGLGVPPDEQARIFEKFFRGDPEMRTGIGGTGLGLYISSELVAQMGGSIGVDSREGGGAVFTVELPDIAQRL